MKVHKEGQGKYMKIRKKYGTGSSEKKANINNS